MIDRSAIAVRNPVKYKVGKAEEEKKFDRWNEKDPGGDVKPKSNGGADAKMENIESKQGEES